jgi:hypothetical protein
MKVSFIPTQREREKEREREGLKVDFVREALKVDFG